MARAIDVAKYICAKAGPMTAVKLQKLVYYCQAWSLVWDEEPLFEEEIQAWANGPVVPTLYQVHWGQFKVDEAMFGSGDVEVLTENQRDSIDKVLEAFQDKSGQWLSELSHRELPWKEARGDLKPMERGSEVISLAAMHEYYSGLYDDQEAV
ncbi:MAG: Panacea domain-containing protein [Prochlorothrix sp.]